MNTTALEQLDWYHPTLSRHLAESLLLQNGTDGTYLLRPSSVEGELALSIRCMETVKHFPIYCIHDGYTFGMANFGSMSDLQKHFENHPLIGAESGVLTVLKYPYSRNVQEPSIYDTVKVQAEYGKKKNTADQALDFSIASKEGFLTKQGFVIKNWKVRWFVLVKNELKYFKNNQEKTPLKTLDLRQCTEVAEDMSVNKKHCFRLVFPKRTYYMHASSDREAHEWLDILQWKLKQKDRTASNNSSSSANSFNYD